MMLLAS